MGAAYYCPWLEWVVNITCNYDSMSPYLDYYFQLFVKTGGDVKDARIYTEINILDDKVGITITCGHSSRRVPRDCSIVMGIVAEFCNGDFLKHIKREWCLLHGAAVSRDGTMAHIFLAASGGGKSTLAYYACKRGFFYCTDDLVVFDVEANCLLPYPKPLFLRTTDCLADEGNAGGSSWNRFRMRFSNEETKYPLFPTNCLRNPVYSCAIHIYEQGSSNAFDAVEKTKAFQYLLKNSLRISDMKTHIHQLAQIVRLWQVDRMQCKDLQGMAEMLDNI